MENSKVKSLADYRLKTRSGTGQQPAGEPPKPRLLDQVRHAIRTRHYSPKTEEA